MAVAQSSLDTRDRVAPLASTYPRLSRTQQVVLECVAAIPNLRDEEDVQCSLFLADEFALLRPNPFYFSGQGDEGAVAPCSLILRDTLGVLLDRGLIVRDERSLRAYSGIMPRGLLSTAVAWLATLSPRERLALAQAVLTLRAQGLCAQARSAGPTFRQTLGQLLGSDAAESLLCRLPVMGGL